MRGLKRKIYVLSTVFLIMFVVFLQGGKMASAASLHIPLKITNDLSFDRSSEPVTSGIPIPKSYDIHATDY